MIRQLPIPDHDSKPWWDGLGRGELLLQRCVACGRLRWPPRAVCNRCHSVELEWASAHGIGTIVSWTVTHPRSDATAAEPYAVVLVCLAEQDDILLPGDFPISNLMDLAIGTEVVVEFVDVEADDGRTGRLLQWRPVTRPIEHHR